MLARAYPIEIHVDAYMAFMARLGYIQMFWNPCMQVDQPFNDSDIAHGNTEILYVPTNMEKSWITAMNPQEIIGLLLIAAVAGGILSIALQGTVKRL